MVRMSDPDAEAEAVERWLDQLDPDDPTVRVYDVEALSRAARQLEQAVADALAAGVPARVIRLTTELLEDRLSVLLRRGETIPAPELWDQLGLRDDDS
ncbi:hypothetical protein A5622_00375 [Mycobacterium sp. 1245801.1]|nr:hypothetical protein A5622_00375 [Mycobacterium sp. 1245801.1]